jgi:thioredoxin 2
MANFYSTSPSGAIVFGLMISPRTSLDCMASSIIRCPHCNAANRVQATASGVPRCAKCQEMLPWLVDATDATFAEETTASVPVIVDFWAPWCGPCRMVSPVLASLAGKYAGRVKVVKLNVDDNQRAAARFEARSIPLMVLMRDGAEADRMVGAVPERQLDAWLTPHLAAVAR